MSHFDLITELVNLHLAFLAKQYVFVFRGEVRRPVASAAEDSGWIQHEEGRGMLHAGNSATVASYCPPSHSHLPTNPSSDT